MRFFPVPLDGGQKAPLFLLTSACQTNPTHLFSKPCSPHSRRISILHPIQHLFFFFSSHLSAAQCVRERLISRPMDALSARERLPPHSHPSPASSAVGALVPRWRNAIETSDVPSLDGDGSLQAEGGLAAPPAPPGEQLASSELSSA